MTDPRIYVADLAAYNEGTLHGAWIDANQDAESIHTEISAMLLPGHEEWAIHGFEGFEGIRLSEYENIETVSALAALIAEHGAAFAAFYGYQPSYWQDNLDSVESEFEEAYQGEHANEEEFGWSLYEDTGAKLPKGHMLENYISFAVDAWSRDLFLGGDYWSADNPEGGIFVFRSI
jgi:antirestriction protein